MPVADRGRARVPGVHHPAADGGSVSRAFAARGLGATQGGWERQRPSCRSRRAGGRTASRRGGDPGLAQIGVGEAAAPLRAVAQARDADPNLRLEAVTALGVLKDHASLDVVIDAVSSPWPAMRAAGLRALKDIDLDTFVIVLSGLDADPHVSVRTAVVSLLPALGRPAVPRLSALMAGGEPAVAAAAIEAIAGMPRNRETSPPHWSACLPAAT